MKQMRWIIFLLIAILPGCGGGDGGTSTSQSPVASNFVLLPSETGKFDARVDFADQGGDVTSVTVVLYDANGVKIGSSTSQVSGIAGLTSGWIRGRLNFSSIPAGDYSAELYLTDSGGLESNRISKSFSAAGGFGQAANYQNPSNYLYLGDTAIGDLNGDGRNDAVAIQGSNNTGLLMIYYQSTSGALNNPITMTSDLDTRGIAIADLNNDGKADLVVSGLSKSALVGWLGRIVVFLQDPASGQLLPPREYIVSSNHIFKVAVADLNSDSLNDVVVMAPQVGMPGNLSIFFQNTDNILNPEVVYDRANIMFDGEIHVADMDNDGRNDIVVQSGQKELAVIRQIAPGIFNSTPDLYTVQTSYWPYFSTFALGDVNGDGRIDVVATGPGNSNYINIFLQNSLGKLDQPALLQIEDVPFGVKIADITGDGLNDIMIDVSGGIVIFQQQSNHTFGSRLFYGYQSSTSGGSPVHQALSIGDVTGDGQLDAVLTWSDEGLYVFPYCAQLLAK